jgi:hypothetical protein
MEDTTGRESPTPGTSLPPPAVGIISSSSVAGDTDTAAGHPVPDPCNASAPLTAPWAGRCIRALPGLGILLRVKNDRQAVFS